MSSRPTSASMLSMLPQPIQPIPGDSFNDRILLLLAAVATTDDMLTYREYQLVQEAAQAIFGERALHAELQAKLHYALLNPPSDPADIARDMANQADAQKVSSTFVDTMLKALSRIGGQEERIDEKARSLVNDIEWAFRKSRLERSAGRGIGLGLNVGESLGELYRKATNVLPSRKEIAGWFAPETSQFNADMERFANSLDRIAWTLDDMDLREELYIFRKMLRRQPFKIVIVGERKRGKSSLINAIIGQELSPVRESTPETATVVEFKYAHAPDYSVRFLDSSQFARLEDYLENEQDNLLLTRKIEHIRKGVSDGTFIPGKLLSGITCWDDLSDYISLEGRFSGFVARVSVGLPLDTLRAGVVLVDTPGLNDTDQFHDYLSYEESLEADCVIFVMDARDPGSNSELSLLRKLARSGRTVSIIGVLTNIDRLNSAASLEAAREQARTVLREACRSSGHVELAGVVALNTRQAVEERCRGGSAFSETLSKVSRSVSGCGELEQLLALLREIMDRDAGKEAYRHKIAEAYSRIADSARERLRQHVQEYRESLPNPELLGMLDAHAKQLSASALSSLEQARQVVNAAAKDLDAWDESTEKALKKFHETLVLRLMDAVNRKVADLGHQFAKDSVWKEFDATEARAIARRAVDEFLDEQRGILHTPLFRAHGRIFAGMPCPPEFQHRRPARRSGRSERRLLDGHALPRTDAPAHEEPCGIHHRAHRGPPHRARADLDTCYRRQHYRAGSGKPPCGRRVRGRGRDGGPALPPRARGQAQGRIPRQTPPRSRGIRRAGVRRPPAGTCRGPRRSGQGVRIRGQTRLCPRPGKPVPPVRAPAPVP